jgi:MFS family permease
MVWHTLARCHADDYAPAASKAKWFAAFYLCIPVGFALGYIFGGIITTALSWRWAFIIEGLVMLPFIAFALTAQPLHLAGSVAKAGERPMSLAGAWWPHVACRATSMMRRLRLHLGCGSKSQAACSYVRSP